MPVAAGAVATEVNLNATTPPPPAGAVNVQWQAGAAYPDPNLPGKSIRDTSAYFFPPVLDGYTDADVPTPATDGVTVAFSLARAPVAGSLELYLNGQLLREGAGNDYLLSGASITIATAPASTDVLIGFYRFPQTGFADAETPTPATDGATVAFNLIETPTANTLRLYKNGFLLAIGAGNDYTLVGKVVTMATAPAAIDVLEAFYKFAPVQSSFVYAEIPGGTIGGGNTAFTLAQTPSPLLSLKLFQNGQLLRQGGGNDYTISGTAITMATAPAVGDKLVAYYRF